MGPDSEVEANEERNGEPEGSGGDCVRFRADIGSESEDNEPCGICLEDARFARGEEARRLDVEQELELDYSGGRHDWDEISSAEKYFPEINDRVVLRTPRSWYNLMPLEKVAIGVYSKNLLGIAATAKSIAKYVPDKVENALQKRCGMYPELLGA